MPRYDDQNSGAIGMDVLIVLCAPYANPAFASKPADDFARVVFSFRHTLLPFAIA